MALEYHYDASARLLRIKGSGVVSVTDRASFVRALMSDATLPATTAVLIDVAQIDNAPIDAEIGLIGLMIERLRSRFRARLAIVNSTVGHVTISHLIAVTLRDAGDWLGVFASGDEARAWLADA